MRIHWLDSANWTLNSKQGHYNHVAINLTTVNPDNKNDNRLQIKTPCIVLHALKLQYAKQGKKL